MLDLFKKLGYDLTSLENVEFSDFDMDDNPIQGDMSCNRGCKLACTDGILF